MTEHTHTASVIVEAMGLWFDDGNLVILAESADRTHSLAFKLHCCVLCDRSAVFSGMFVASTADEYYADGTPLVRLPDSAEALRLLFELMYGARCVARLL